MREIIFCVILNAIAAAAREGNGLQKIFHLELLPFGMTDVFLKKSIIDSLGRRPDRYQYERNLFRKMRSQCVSFARKCGLLEMQQVC